MRGLSLLETVLATFMLAGVMLLLLELYPTTSLAVRRGQDQLQADALAHSMLESLEFHQLTPGRTVRPAVMQGGLRFVPTVEVFPVSGSNPDLLLGVRVTVAWQAVRGPRSVTQQIYKVKVDP